MREMKEWPLNTYRLLILGTGNPLRRDDGIGVHIAHELENLGMPQGVKVLDAGTGGLALVDFMRAFPKVLFLDAVDMGEAPGTVKTFAQEDMLAAVPVTQVSLHDMGLPHVLLLASLQGVSPEILIVGIQPKDLGWGIGLSPELERAVPTIVQHVLAEIETGGASAPPESSFLAENR